MIGQFVPQVKPNVSNAIRDFLSHNRVMAKDVNQKEFSEAFCARTKDLRLTREGWSAEDMAIALGVEPAAYRKYEVRTPLPHYLIERFAKIVGRDVAYVLTGKSAGRQRPGVTKSLLMPTGPELEKAFLDALPDLGRRSPERQAAYLVKVVERALSLPPDLPDVPSNQDAHQKSDGGKAGPARRSTKKA